MPELQEIENQDVTLTPLTPSPAEQPPPKVDSARAVDDEYAMRTYARLPVTFVRGSGARLWDIDGREYLDFVAGIAVNGVGHCHPRVVQAVQDQAAILIHTSNLYQNVPQAFLAYKLADLAGMDRVFLCNSGAEAIEAALKLARKHGHSVGGESKFRVVTANNSFHGRTMGAITATGQPKYQKDFAPLVPGFDYVPYNDIDALKEAVTAQTCAVLLEPIQGESGIWPATREYLKLARDLCDRHNALLLFDEIQTGLGRTGHWWAYQHYDVVPDVMTSAKALGGGIPIGACLAKGAAANVFQPGDHGSTFAGNPLACRAAIATLEAIEEEGLVLNARTIGGYLEERLRSPSFAHHVKEVRGMGLMLGLELNEGNAKRIQKDALAKGLIVNAIGDTTIRLLPPLIIERVDADEAVEILASVL